MAGFARRQTIAQLPVMCWQEYERRFAIWADNLNYIISYNAEHTSHWVRDALACFLSSDRARTLRWAA